MENVMMIQVSSFGGLGTKDEENWMIWEKDKDPDWIGGISEMEELCARGPFWV